jgi:hypothetical protein
MMDRRSTDQASHAHKRQTDANDFAKLHKRLDDNDGVLTELLAARAESVKLHNDTTAAVTKLTDSVTVLTKAVAGLATETVGARETEADIRGMVRFLGRISEFVGVLWKPLLFVAVLSGTLWLWVTGQRLPP